MNSFEQPDAGFTPGIDDEMYDDVVNGLKARPRSIPPKYLYDDRGSQLFNQICELDEYYPTDTEIELLEHHADDIAAHLGSNARLVELGTGSGLKTRILLDRLHELSAYVPVEISPCELQRCVDRLTEQFPSLDIIPVCTDFTSDWELPTNGFDGRTAFFYPGSTIGNFEPDHASHFMRRLSRMSAPRGAMIVGVDLHKDPAIILPAYDDSRGVTAEFILNLLRRLNRECGANFRLDQFEYEAVYQDDHHRVQMRLVSRCEQTVNFPDNSFRFEPGEAIVAEHSYKYTIEDFAELADEAGWRTRAIWTDDDRLFSIWFLENNGTH